MTVWEMEVDENENVYRFLSTNKRAKCEGRRVIAHVSQLPWHQGWFHKNCIFDESSGGSNRLCSRLCGLGP
jgi:hypothetical protein